MASQCSSGSRSRPLASLLRRGIVDQRRNASRKNTRNAINFFKRIDPFRDSKRPPPLMAVPTKAASLQIAEDEGLSPFVNPQFKQRPRYPSTMDIKLPLSCTDNSLTGVPECWVYNQHREKVRMRKLSADLFCQPARRDLLTTCVRWETLSKWGWAKSGWDDAFLPKRDQLTGSTRKVRPQKGTGKSPMSDLRAHHLRRGGKRFGPQPRFRGFKMPQKVWAKTVKVALSTRYRENMFFLWDKFECDTYKTKHFKQLIHDQWEWHRNNRVLIYHGGEIDKNFYLAARNMNYSVMLRDIKDFSVYDVLLQHCVVMDEAAYDYLFDKFSLEAEVGRWNEAAAVNRRLEAEEPDAFPEDVMLDYPDYMLPVVDPDYIPIEEDGTANCRVWNTEDSLQELDRVNRDLLGVGSLLPHHKGYEEKEAKDREHHRMHLPHPYDGRPGQQESRETRVAEHLEKRIAEIPQEKNRIGLPKMHEPWPKKKDLKRQHAIDKSKKSMF